MPFGAQVQPDGKVRFRIWAPAAESVSVSVDEGRKKLPLAAKPGGWRELLTNEANTGTLSRYILPDGTLVPYPASRFQPQDVHGSSEVIDPGEYAWTDDQWNRRLWHETALYELHIGTFTDAIKDSGPRHLLDELAERDREANSRSRAIHLILENEDSQARRLDRNASGQPIHYTAQWNDDIHHVLHTAATVGRTLWQESPEQVASALRPWSVRWSMEDLDR